jgi:hypothetical protein
MIGTPMTSGSKTFGKPEKYGLISIPVGETRRFPGITSEERGRIKRSAHNYNARTDMFFMTRFRDGVLYVTRLK